MLGEGEPVPFRGHAVQEGADLSVGAESAQDVRFEGGVIAAEAHEAGGEIEGGVADAAKGAGRAVAGEVRVPGTFI
jgi:hypothetical protein